MILTFPAVEIYLLVVWLGNAPLLGTLYIVLSMAAGVLCIKFAKLGFAEFIHRLQAAARAGDAPSDGMPLLLFGKMWIIGALLFFPGYLTDLIAVCVWLFLRPRAAVAGAPTRQPPDIVETDGRFMDDDKLDNDR